MEDKFKDDLKSKEVLSLCSNIFYWEKPEKSNADTYIRWFILDEQERAFAGNKPLYTEFDIQVDVYSKGNPNTISDAVKNTLKSKGYYLLSIENSVSKNGDIRMYYKTLRFRFNKYN